MKFVSRVEWGARKPTRITPFVPYSGTTVHWEGPRMGTFPHSQCAGKVRTIQDYHMDTKGWTDIAYTAVVCPHGYTFEGRWLRHRTGANGTNAGNHSWYGVCCLIGEGDPVPAALVAGLWETCHYLRTHGDAGPRVNAHSDHKPTACPGPYLTDLAHSGRLEQPYPGEPTPEPPKGWLMALNDDQQEDLYEKVKILHRHLIEGPDPAPEDDGDRKKMTWSQRVIASLRRIEGEVG